MELDAAIARRRMHRAFLDQPVPAAVVDRLLARAARAPSAGHTQGWDWLVLDRPEQRRRFWEADADPAWLAAPDHPGLLMAPVIVIPWADPGAYRDRYAAADKRRRVPSAAGADAGTAAPGAPPWNVPYWLTDTAFATMLLLLGVVEEELGALFFALHGPAQRLRAAFAVPDDRVALGAVAIGWPDPGDATPGWSARTRRRRPLDAQTHRGAW